MKVSAIEIVTEKLYVESDIDETIFNECKSEKEVMELLEERFYDNSIVVESEHIDTEDVDFDFEPILTYWRKINNSKN